MKRIMIAAALASALLPAAASAQSRPSTTNLSCQSARQIVARSGAAVLSTGRNTYDRFVASRAFCQFNEYTEPAYAPAADTPQCLVGYVCRSGPPPFFDWD